MDVTIEKEDRFEIVVLAEEFDSKTSNREIAKFWDRYYEAGYDKVVPPMLGVCIPNLDPSKEKGKFRYGIGSLKDYCGEIPQGFEQFTVPQATWGKFYTKGAMPDAILKLWPEAMKWAKNNGYEVISGFDFECYSEGDSSSPDYVSGVWIALKTKEENE